MEDMLSLLLIQIQENATHEREKPHRSNQAGRSGSGFGKSGRVALIDQVVLIDQAMVLINQAVVLVNQAVVLSNQVVVLTDQAVVLIDQAFFRI